ENDAAASNSANYTLFGLGTRYLQLLGNQGGPSWQANQFGTGPNPGGGGAPAAPEPPPYRGWTELYALTSDSGAQPFFPAGARRAAALPWRRAARLWGRRRLFDERRVERDRRHIGRRQQDAHRHHKLAAARDARPHPGRRQRRLRVGQVDVLRRRRLRLRQRR